MDLLIVILIVLLVLALAIYAVRLIGASLKLDGNIVTLIQVVIVVIAIIYIVRAAGLA